LNQNTTIVSFVGVILFIICVIAYSIIDDFFKMNKINEIEKQAITYIEKIDKIDTKKKKQNTPKQYSKNKPLLAIIIDDISFQSHLRLMDTIDIPINLSFLPPTDRHPESHNLANNYDSYMVHLPLQAINYHASESKTMGIQSSYQDMENTILEIKQLFPKVKYINNHTGSKFTAHLSSMNKLADIFKKNNLIFLDSKTTHLSKAKEAFGNDVLTRDVFLDNEDNIQYIKKQLKWAVSKAIKQGYSISIGHPRKNTILAIKELSDYMQNKVRIVYIDELDTYLHNL